MKPRSRYRTVGQALRAMHDDIFRGPDDRTATIALIAAHWAELAGGAAAGTNPILLRRERLTVEVADTVASARLLAEKPAILLRLGERFPGTLVIDLIPKLLSDPTRATSAPPKRTA